MADSKRYTLINTGAGTRGLSTGGPDGTVMVPAQPLGTTGGGVIATLTDDEVKDAKAIGFEVKELGDTDRNGITGTENLPAAGYVDPNHPDAADMHEDARKAVDKRTAEAAKARPAAPAPATAPAKKDD